ncbi:hypothetical protein D5S18_19925 [Nocardia panacis]|uniref:Uncharacterized protein n=1 Tax=Nocardia panacis TaxID=2340916 RepID=A0A3A4KUD0_9NOCA|nr:hypothetical protein [Nocardia panacis]RJO73484.1 hypothetical protein D5S18_19925 [Nocardia panacis]
MGSYAVRRGRERVPGWFHGGMQFLALVVLLVCVALFWQVGIDGRMPVLVALWAALGLLTALAALLGLVGIVRYHTFFAALKVPLFIAALGVLIWYDMPRETIWQLSHTIMEREARECADPGRSTHVGLYTIVRMAARDGGCLFYTKSGDGTGIGYAFFPGDPPPQLGPPAPHGTAYQPWHEFWYRFTDEA